MFSSIIRSLMVIGITTWALPVYTHHSHGNYDLTKYIDMEGTVTEAHWINPHTWVYIEVIGEGDTSTIWALEGGGINGLTRKGWTEDSVKVGDNISVRCHPLKAGTPACLFGFLKTEDGTEGEYD
jgi:hypothetical protein